MPTNTAADEPRYIVLVEFAHKHLDFQLPELDAVLEIHGIVRGSNDCLTLPLPRNESHHHHQQEPNSNGTKARSSYNTEPDCRPFLLLSLPADSPFNPHKSNNNNDTNSQQQDIGTILLSRCTLVRSVLEVWGLGETLQECSESTLAWVKDNNLGRQVFSRHGSVDYSWKITIHTLGSTFTRQDQENFRAHFSQVGWKGDVVMKDPSDEYVLIREVALNHMGGALYPREKTAATTERPPLACYFGRVLGGARQLKGRANLGEYSLTKRPYLGPTSMDAELSFIMTNLGQVKAGSMVLDPFVGTGSILLSCACRGAYCVGTDIDIRVLRGKGNDQTIYNNFQQYNLPRPELIRSDNAIYQRHFRRSTIPIYDAIICDPPYGIRAGARKSGSRLDNPRPVEEDRRIDHIAQTKPYSVSDVMADLLDVAARVLVMGGRLVYIIPSMSDFNAEDDLPRHSCLEIVTICYQPLSSELGRRMVAMKKIAPYDESKQELYLSSVWKNGAESANKCANIRDKINEAAKLKPDYAEKSAFRKKKRRKLKEERKKLKSSPIAAREISHA